MSQAKNITRLRNLGLQGPFNRKDYSTESRNLADSYIVTVEFPITRVASTSAQNTGVFPSPKSKFVQVLSAFVVTTTAEVTGTTKTVSIGIGASGTNVVSAAPVDQVRATGSPLTSVINVNNTNNFFTYTLGANNFAEFTGYAVVTCLVVE